MSEWSYHNDYNPSPRQKMTHVELTKRFESLQPRGRARLHRRADRPRGPALPQLRHPDRLHGAAVHRVRRLHRHLPGAVPDHHQQRRRGGPARTALGAGDQPRPGALRLRRRCPRPDGVMVKDENVCVHCGLCAERCPTAAWDMEQFDLQIPYAGRRELHPRRRDGAERLTGRS